VSGFTGKCSGTKKDGSPCTQPPRGNGFCRFHGGVRAAKVVEHATDNTGLAAEIAMLRRFIRDQTTSKGGAVSEQQIRKIGTTLDRLTKAFAAQQRYELAKRHVMDAHDMAGFLLKLFDAVTDTIEGTLLEKFCDRVGEIFRTDCPTQWRNLPQQALDEVTNPRIPAPTTRRTTVIHEDAIPPLPRSGKPQNLGVRH
jgi:hypothetical protein